MMQSGMSGYWLAMKVEVFVQQRNSTDSQASDDHDPD